MWVNLKVQDRRREQAFMREGKTFQPKATQYPATLFQIYPEQVR